MPGCIWCSVHASIPVAPERTAVLRDGLSRVLLMVTHWLAVRPHKSKMDHGMRVELMVSVLQTGAFYRFAIRGKSCKAGFLPANHTRVNGFRFCRYAIFVGGVRRPIRVPLLRFRSIGHDRQDPQAVVGPSEFPSDLSIPRRLTPTRRIQGTSSKLLAQNQSNRRICTSISEYPVDLTIDGLEPPFGFLKPDSPSGGLHFSSAMLPNGLEPNKGLEPLT